MDPGLTEIGNSREAAHGDRVLDLWGLGGLPDVQMDPYREPFRLQTQKGKAKVAGGT